MFGFSGMTILSRSIPAFPLGPRPSPNSSATVFLAFVLALSLADCSSSSKEPEENPNLLPAEYKNEILNTLINTLEDPTNVRDAYITDPTLRSLKDFNASFGGPFLKDRLWWFGSFRNYSTVEATAVPANPGMAMK